MKRLLVLFALLTMTSLAGWAQPQESPRCQDNQILYTNGSTFEKEEFSHSINFYANLLSHKYSKEKECWVLTYDRAVTSIGKFAFLGYFVDYDKFQSITIPKSVTTIEEGAFKGCAGELVIYSPLVEEDQDSDFDTTDYDSWLSESSFTSLVIGEGITAIGSYAFHNYPNLKQVTFPSTLQSIGAGAFAGCELDSIVIPESVTHIGDGAFAGCELDSIVIPESVTYIGDGAFAGCKLNSIVIPESVTYIGDGAFAGCSGELIINSKFIEGNHSDQMNWISDYEGERIIVGDGITRIGDFALFGSFYTEEIILPESLTSIGIGAFAGNGIDKLTIPESVTEIGMAAFTMCKNLTSITIPEGVTSIEEGLFAACSNLSSVVIPKSVTKIAESAFYECPNLKSVYISDLEALLNIETTPRPFGLGFDLYLNNQPVTDLVIPEGVTQISNIFVGSNIKSVTIPEGVTLIDKGNFEECRNLKSITLPKSLTKIAKDAFNGCPNLESVHISDLEAWCKVDSPINPFGERYNLYVNNQPMTDLVIPDEVTTIGNALTGCHLTSVVIPDHFSKLTYTNGSTTKPITPKGFNANILLHFYNAKEGHWEIIFDAPITKIESSAFENCSNLVSITLPEGITSIGNSAFNNCSNLVSITLPESITSIESWAFNNCSNLVSITLPESLTSIGIGAFAGTGIDKLTIPESVTEIEFWAFNGCTNLERFESKWASADKRALIFDGELAAFAPAGLSSYTIPDGVTTIREGAFSACSRLTTITIPNSVNYIKAFAFENCNGLTSITIPKSVREIEIIAFFGCNNLQSVYCEATTPPTYVILEEWLDGYDMDDNPTVFTPTNVGQFNIYIPHNCIDAYKADEEWNKLANYFTMYDYEKGEVYIPKPAQNEIWYTNGSEYNSSISEENYSNYGIVSEEYNSWLECWVVTFSSTVTIVEDMLSGTVIRSVTLPESVTEIGEEAFIGCNSLESITIPNSVTTIYECAFYGCSSLEEITLGKGVKHIRSVTLPESVTEIGAYAFASCRKLTTITIPNSVTTIHEGAFWDCSSLEEITLGKGVKHIVSTAFLYCESLKRVYCNIATPPQAIFLTSYGVSLWCAFDDCSQDLKIYVPRTKVQSYKAASGWKDYAANIVGHDF